MTMKIKTGVSEALDSLDLFICENCGSEFPIAPEASNQIDCPRCDHVNCKSRFISKIRKTRVWISKAGVPDEVEKAKVMLERVAAHSTCWSHYRSVVRFRQTIFDLYEERGKITLAQAIGIFVSFFIDTEEGILTLSRESRDLLLDWLASMQIKRGPGRLPKSDSLLLFLDAMMLLFCPNAYEHLLCDALRLRAQEYKVKGNYAMGHRERWDGFWKAKRAVEVACKRIWWGAFNQSPGPHRENWWERVARQQGLMA